LKGEAFHSNPLSLREMARVRVGFSKGMDNSFAREGDRV
jgi:hypothetical protein